MHRGQIGCGRRYKAKVIITILLPTQTKNNSYAVVQFTKGKYKIKYYDNLSDEKTLLDYGVRTISGDINPNMPILAWDGKVRACYAFIQKKVKPICLCMMLSQTSNALNRR